MADKRKIVIQGLEFEASTPYVAGQTINEVEAKTLNQTRCENLRNNFATKVKAHLDGAEGALSENDLYRAFEEYDASYTFAMPGAGARQLDPIEREARTIARELIREQLAEQGRKLKEIPEDKLEAKIDEIAQDEEVLKYARQRVNAKAKATSSLKARFSGVTEEGEAAPTAA